MSNPTASNQPLPPIDPEIGLMFCAANHLIPLFKADSIDDTLARRMAVSALYAYQPETRADFVNVARTIAFSMAALALLGQAASLDMTMPEKMRTFGRANALNRSADQSERTMMQRRRQQKASPQTEQPQQAPEPDIQMTDAEMDVAIAGVMQDYLATCPKPAKEAAAAKASPAPVAPAPPLSAAPPSAIHYSVTMPKAGHLGATPFKEALLRQSAMPREVGQSGGQHPR
jgi:hypothetical protein